MVWTFPAYVGILMLMIWSMLLVVSREHSLWLPPVFGLPPGLPVVLAGAAALGLQRSSRSGSRIANFITFVAIRPLTSGQIVFAKFLMAAYSALLTWVIALVLPLLWILLSDNFDRATKLMRDILDIYSGRRRS